MYNLNVLFFSGISHVYTFAPAFRAEHSRGRHHLSEFYMLEGEVAFITEQDQLMDVRQLSDISQTVALNSSINGSL